MDYGGNDNLVPIGIGNGVIFAESNYCLYGIAAKPKGKSRVLYLKPRFSRVRETVVHLYGSTFCILSKISFFPFRVFFMAENHRCQKLHAKILDCGRRKLGSRSELERKAELFAKAAGAESSHRNYNFAGHLVQR